MESISNSPNKEQYVFEIYEYLYANYSEYLHANWKNSVRHALSYKKLFKHVKKNSRVGTWIIDDTFNANSSLGIGKKRRRGVSLLHKPKLFLDPKFDECSQVRSDFLKFINS